MEEQEELPQPAPREGRVKAGIRESCWGDRAALHPQNRRGKYRVAPPPSQGNLSNSAGAPLRVFFSSEPQETRQGGTGFEGSRQEETSPGEGW